MSDKPKAPGPEVGYRDPATGRWHVFSPTDAHFLNEEARRAENARRLARQKARRRKEKQQ